MRLTEREHLALAARMEQCAQQKWLTGEQREDYLFKAARFRMLARYAKQRAAVGKKETSATVIRLNRDKQS